MSAEERVVGKVARINSDRELIINRGTEHGVDKGMIFYVRDEPIEVRDPDSDEVLGSVTPIKVVVRAEEVTERICIARTFRSTRVLVAAAVPGGAMHGGGLGNLFQPPRPAEFETRTETLRLDPNMGEPIDDYDSVVQVGDLVESVLPGEDTNPVTTTLFK